MLLKEYCTDVWVKENTYFSVERNFMLTGPVQLCCCLNCWLDKKRSGGWNLPLREVSLVFHTYRSNPAYTQGQNESHNNRYFNNRQVPLPAIITSIHFSVEPRTQNETGISERQTGMFLHTPVQKCCQPNLDFKTNHLCCSSSDHRRL